MLQDTPKNGALSMFDLSGAGIRPLDDSTREAAANEVIDQVNREYPAATLQNPSEAERQSIQERIGALVSQALRRRSANPGSLAEAALANELARRLMGLGFLDLLLPPARQDISEITVYSSGLVQVMKRGSIRWETVPDLQPDAHEIERVLDRLLGPQNKSLNETNPSINARLPRTRHNPGGGRIKALHRSIVPPGRNHSINIRLYEQKPVQPEWLLERGVMDEAMMDFLRQAVQDGQRMLITGGTRTGKTTLLSALCSFLPPGWRIVKIEDPEEIWVDSPTVQTIEARPAVVGAELRPYTLADGVDDAMRMSPDYLIIGEVRDGRAALALLRAMMTGHSGACTFHADSPREAGRRLATVMGADTGVYAREANQMAADAIDLLVQIGIRREVRRVTAICRVAQELKNNDLSFEMCYRFDEHSALDAPRWEKVGDW